MQNAAMSDACRIAEIPKHYKEVVIYNGATDGEPGVRTAP